MAKLREFKRTDRVASAIRRALAGPIGAMAREHGAGLVTITHVDVAPDLRRARLDLSVLGAPAGSATAFVASLRTNAAQLQAVLGRELSTRRTPVLRFSLDETPARAERINRLLDDAPPRGSGAV